MAVFRDKKNGSWYVQFRFTDWKGQRQQKLKRGFSTKKEAQNWERQLSSANLGVYPSPFCHQISALEAAYAGQDLFVSTGTGSGKTECFMWPLLAKLAAEARNSPNSWSMRGVRTIIMYPMNALVSDQVSRLRRLIGDPEHQFVNIFRGTCGRNSRRPQFGMYTGRTPYAGIEPKRREDRSLAATYSSMVNAETDDKKRFFKGLSKTESSPQRRILMNSSTSCTTVSIFQMMRMPSL